MGAKDLGISSVIFTLLLLLVPFAVILISKLKISFKVLVSVFRMIVQLSLIGFYLKYIFILDNLFVNIGWLVAMGVVSTITIINSNGLKLKHFILPIMFSIVVPLLFNTIYFTKLIINLEFLFTAKYLIPIAGMLLGNTMRANIIVTRTFLNYFKNREQEYYFALSLGASRSEALKEIVIESMRTALEPTIASMANIGLVSLPGMMTGQILGGSNPMTAIKYQIAIMIAIFSTMSLSSMMLIAIIKRTAFSEFDTLREDIFKRS